MFFKLFLPINYAFQDNVFVTLVASIQYRALADKAADAFYKLSNTKEQIQAYVLDGWIPILIYLFVVMTFYDIFYPNVLRND